MTHPDHSDPPATSSKEEPWTIQDTVDLYRLDAWSEGYFVAGASGHLMVQPDNRSGHQVDLFEIVRGLEERGIRSPVTIGFPDLLRRRIEEMVDAFGDAIESNNYRGGYSGVYPVKVNQQRFLVEQVEAIGRDLNFGLEVGSKPELLAVMGMTADSPDRLIVCNGFKEERYLRHVMLATKLGRRIVAVIENLDELDTLVRVFQESGARPMIGIRLKLDSHGSGRWRHSTGEKAKFGLSIPGVLKVVKKLEEVGMLDCLVLLHCHMGSQISDIQVVNAGLGRVDPGLRRALPSRRRDAVHRCRRRPRRRLRRFPDKQRILDQLRVAGVRGHGGLPCHERLR